MKKIFYLIALVVFTLTSCDKNEVSNDISSQLSPEDLKIASAMQKVAKEICIITNDNNAVNEILSMVNASVNYGLDEDVNFEDLFNVGESKIIAKPQRTKIAKAISNSKATNDLDSSVSLLLENGTRLYWPYSTNWDGSEQPVITYAAVDSKEDKLIAYKLSNVNGVARIDSIIIDENYAMNNPVWVITKSETDYKDLPNFVEGENAKNNIIYARSAASVKKIAQEEYPLNDPNYVYNLILGRVQCVTQYDSWFFGGGSELRFAMVGAKMLGDQLSTDFSAPIIKMKFSRDEIKKKTWKNINTLINFDFTPREVFNGFAIWEDDGGENSQKVKFDIGYDKIKAAAEFTIGKKDELIYRVSLERSAFFSTNKTSIGNGLYEGFTIYSAGGGVFYTLPWQIIPRAY